MSGGGRKPDYRIAALNKATEAKSGNIGGAWIERDGRISIKFSEFVDPAKLIGPDVVISLFKNDEPAEQGLSPQKRGYDDEIPF